MSKNDQTTPCNDQNVNEACHESESLNPLAQSADLPRGARVQRDTRNTPKPHKNTGSLDSLGGGRLP